MNLEIMKSDLGMSCVPECFDAIFDEIKDSYEKRAALILSDEYIVKVLEDSGALLPYMNVVLDAANEVRRNAAMRLLVCILEKWVISGGNANDISYDSPHGEGIAYDFVHLFAALPTIPDTVKFFRDRGVPDDIVLATIQEYDYCLEMCRMNIGRIAFDRGRLGWIRLTVQKKLIRIDRFKYELPTTRLNGARVYKNDKGEILVLADGLHMHKKGRVLGSIYCEDDTDSFVADIEETETEITGHVIIDGEVSREKATYLKSEWEVCLSKEDPVIPVHIPREGAFDTESVEKAYERLREIMAKCFPDMPYKAIHCHTWMLSRDLRKVLKPESNILAFQNKFIHYPSLSAGTWVFGFVFPGEKGITDIDNLSETTSLQRNVKELYKNGDAIYDDKGFFF